LKYSIIAAVTAARTSATPNSSAKLISVSFHVVVVEVLRQTDDVRPA
jgi:hypothetical protein